jgi:hypothetical protein
MEIDLPDAQPAEDLETCFKRPVTFCAPRARRGHQAASMSTSGTSKERK